MNARQAWSRFEVALPVLLVGAVAVLTIVAAYWRLSALNPPSFWLDDQWVGIVARKMSLADFFEYDPPIPIGFAGALAALAHVFDDPEWPLQVVPILCTIVQVPLIAILVRDVTGRWSVGLLAAGLIAVNVGLAAYGVRPKQYASDSLITTMLLLIALPVLKKPNFRRHAVLALAGVLSLLFSFPSVFLSFALVFMPLLIEAHHRWKDTRQIKRAFPVHAFGVAAAFTVCMVLIYVLLLRSQSNPELKAYWAGKFLPTSSLGAIITYLKTKGWGAIYGTFVPKLRWLAIFVPIGIGGLFWKKGMRWVGALIVGYYLSLLFASALKLYPLGTGRTDIFIYPVTTVAACYGIHVLTSWRRLVVPFDLALVIVVVAIASQFGGVSKYPLRNDAGLVQHLEHQAGPDDGVLIYPHATLAVGYYSRHPIRLRHWGYACGFDAHLTRPGALTLPGLPQWRRHPTKLTPALEEFLTGDYPRIFYIGTHVALGKKASEFIQTSIEEDGYERVSETEARDALLVEFRRVPQEGSESASTAPPP